MKKLIKIIGLALVLAIVKNDLLLAQEDLQGSQFIFDKTFVNPAFSGLNNKLDADVHYQMLGGKQENNNAYVVSAGVNLLLEKAKSGIGFNLVRSAFGNDNYTIGYMNYAYHLKVSEQTTLSSSLSLGVQQYNINLAGAITAESNDPLAQSNFYSSRLNARFGFLASFSDKYYLGASFDNILSKYKNQEDFDKTTPLAYRSISMYLLGGVNLYYDSGISIHPNVLLISNFGGLSSVDLNMLLGFNRTVSFGIGFRQSLDESLSPGLNKEDVKSFSRSLIRSIFQYQVKSKQNNIRIGYCYNFNANKAIAIAHSSHDISLIFSLPRSTSN
ncbi:MAG TPA: PorP/SprF family type IX secretion system membrane protein [Pelobium sp.]|nr:PorP/SprF family type IX secretion system membrane protein [Pelobium sp.]